MGKRSNFERLPRDFYATPEAAVLPLLPHLSPRTQYIEPCAGDGALVDHLARAGHSCMLASDIVPGRGDIGTANALTTEWTAAPMFITNPPWDRGILHPLIEHLTHFAPAWLLFDADWMHTKQSAPFMPLCAAIVSVGRVQWIPGSKMTGKDNCAWYLFDRLRGDGAPFFYGRR